MSYSVLITLPKAYGEAYPEFASLFEKRGCQVSQVLSDQGVEEGRLIELIKDKDACVVSLEKINRRVISLAKNLKAVSKFGVGVDNIDIKAATEVGIAVLNTPGANAETTADFTFGLLLCVSRGIAYSNKMNREGNWKFVVGRETWQKTLGIIGTGAVGKGVIRRAQGFEMKILAFDIYPDQEFAREFGFSYVSLEQLLRQSDFVTIHCPLNEETRSLIGEQELKTMKKEAHLINAARGGIVDEDALYKAIKNGWIAGAVLDVYTQEPPPSDFPLFEFGNVVCTTHIGGSTLEALRRIGERVVDNIMDVLEGRYPTNIINPEVIKNHRLNVHH